MKMLPNYARILQQQPPSAARKNAFPVGTFRKLAPETPPRSHYTRRLCAPHLVAAVAETSPDATALSHGSVSITYAELDMRSNQLASFLRSLGVGPDAPVAICLERSFDYAIATLAVWKAGGAYLPLDPESSAEYREFIIQDAQVQVLITHSAVDFRDGFSKARYVVDLDSSAGLIAREQTVCPIPNLKRDNLACISYTSDSMGEPIGIEVTHGNLLNLIFWHRRTFAVTAADRASHLAGPACDAAMWELWPYLTAGATVALTDERARTSPVMLRDWLVAHEITMAFVPAMLAEPMLAAQWSPNCNLRFLLAGAETLHRYPASDLPFTVINNYGPSECTVVATSGAVTPAGSDRTLPPIGASIANTQIYLLDEKQRRVPNGAVGEIYIGGTGVARGYRNRPALTAEKFLPNPFVTSVTEVNQAQDARMFRTGDLGCQLPDGRIAFRGRVENHAEIRGHRIDLDEITSVLQRHPRVDSCAVAVIEGAVREQCLVAYVVPDNGTPALRTSELREFLAHRLPSFMVPALFTTVSELPLDSNGRLDRAALSSIA
jgi:amino acid adenylation domain-containing protein